MPGRFALSFFAVALLVPAAHGSGIPQDAAAPQATPSPSTAPQSSASSSSSKRKNSHASDFLIRGTVFSDKALAFPGVELRIRRMGEKKFRWQDSSSSRGEFAIRVPQGAEYEMVVHAKGFADQAKTIDARNATSENNVVFRMEPAKKGKK